ncbi:hypothetical protein [Delftia lacustris]|uniref:hypothetical protein n=1 Tax=Delftia TaxID=80865 RepID=UPI002D76F7EE|nr:hypothetical protein [Delftia lacustris]
MSSAHLPEMWPKDGFGHWQEHGSGAMDGKDVAVYSCLPDGEDVSGAKVLLAIGGGDYAMQMRLDGNALACLWQGLHDAGCKARSIRSLAAHQDAPEWDCRVQMTEGFIDAARAGVSYRVFAERLRATDSAVVALNMYMLQGFCGGSEMATGDLTPDAAEELARALMEAAEFARGINAMDKGGAA